MSNCLEANTCELSKLVFERENTFIADFQQQLLATQAALAHQKAATESVKVYRKRDQDLHKNCLGKETAARMAAQDKLHTLWFELRETKDLLAKAIVNYEIMRNQSESVIALRVTNEALRQQVDALKDIIAKLDPEYEI